MNLVLLGGAGVPVLWLGGGFVYFFVPPSAGGGGGGLTAKDALGDDVTTAGWAKAHPFPERSLVQGLKVRASPTPRPPSSESPSARPVEHACTLATHTSLTRRFAAGLRRAMPTT